MREGPSHSLHSLGPMSPPAPAPKSFTPSIATSKSNVAARTSPRQAVSAPSPPRANLLLPSFGRTVSPGTSSRAATELSREQHREITMRDPSHPSDKLSWTTSSKVMTFSRHRKTETQSSPVKSTVQSPNVKPLLPQSSPPSFRTTVDIRTLFGEPEPFQTWRGFASPDRAQLTRSLA